MSKAALAKAQLETLQRELSRRRLMPFIKRFNPKYRDGWVHNDICRRLERFSRAVADGESPRLMILMPPRHGKSEIASRNFPAWHLGQYPEHEFIACSYNLSLAMDFSRKVKGIMGDLLYSSVFDTRLDPHNQSTESWGIERNRGGYVAAGIGGPITGRGAHVLVIDDPVKNAEEADSADTREKVWEWYLSTAYSRLSPGGGVLIIQCMTGDTPVLMADGSERRLDALAAGAEVATYDRGLLSSSRVAAVRSNGRDSVLKITTKSGKIVRANGRHPFLTTTDGGLKWTRARALTTAHKIVALPDRKGSGEVLPAPPTAVTSQLAAEGFAHPTTTSRSGPTGTARPASTQFPAETPTSNTGTASRSGNTTPSWRHKKGSALSAAVSPALHSPITGKISSPLTTATTQARFGGSYVTAATQESDILELSPWHSPLPGISNFILDEIVSVEDDGVEEVFDLQVERTENFIANGLVTHNTWWHDDDLAGRLQSLMRSGSEDEYVDQFEVIKYPAIAEADEFLNEKTDLIEYDPPAEALVVADAQYAPLRKKGEALHPDRYDLDKLLRIKAQNKGGRWWSALYQQNPVPDDGGYFTKDQFRRAPLPSLRHTNVYIAWDFAISEKKQNDFTVGTVIVQDPDDMVHVVDQIRFRSGNAFFIVEAILNLAQKWHNPSLVVGFEDGQIYRAIESLLKKRMRERQFYPPTTVLKPITDKLARGRALQGRMQQGMISFSSVGEWYDGLRTEMLRFPAGAHDDQVDSLSWAVQLVVGREAPKRPAEQKPKSWMDRLQSDGVLSHMVA